MGGEAGVRGFASDNSGYQPRRAYGWQPVNFLGGIGYDPARHRLTKRAQLYLAERATNGDAG